MKWNESGFFWGKALLFEYNYRLHFRHFWPDQKIKKLGQSNKNCAMKVGRTSNLLSKLLALHLQWKANLFWSSTRKRHWCREVVWLSEREMKAPVLIVCMTSQCLLVVSYVLFEIVFVFHPRAKTINRDLWIFLGFVFVIRKKKP